MFRFFRFTVIIPVTVFLFSSVSCVDERKIQATGKLQEIILIGADVLDAGSIKILKKSLERKVNWVIEEKIFILKPVSARNFDLFRMRKNIVIAGIPGHSESMSPLWDEFLDGKVAERYSEKGRVAFFIEDYWSQGQTVYFFAARNLPLLTEIILEKGIEAFSLFEHRLEKRMFDRIYLGGMNIRENRRIARKYPWQLTLPAGYRLRFEEKTVDGDIVGWWKRDPDLQIFIYSEEYPRKHQSVLELIALRDSIASKYYDEDFIIAESVRLTEEEHNGIDVFSIAGAWENRKYMVGGCFKSIVLYDVSNKPSRRYLIDMAVFAPGESKDPLMRQLMKITDSFRLVTDFCGGSL